MTNKEVLDYTRDIVKVNGKELALRIIENCERVFAQPQHITFSDEEGVKSIGKKERRLRKRLQFFRNVLIELKRGYK